MIRAIHAGFEYSLRFVRLDGGVFAVKGSDGDAFESIFVNELLVGIGETFDVELPLDQDTIILRFVFFQTSISAYFKLKFNDYFEIKFKDSTYGEMHW